MKEKKVNQVHVFDYSPSTLEEKNTTDINECIPYKDTDTVTWINVDSAPPIHFLEELRLGFDLHPVVEGDILTLNQRPKIEILDEYLFLRLKMIRVDQHTKVVKHEQISMVVAPRFLLTFQQGVAGDTFESVRNFIRTSNHRVRKLGTDYLCYELIDSMIDGFFDVLDFCSERIDRAEQEIVRDTNPRSLRTLDTIKKELMSLRKAAAPLREIITILERVDTSLIHAETQIYFRDAFTKLIQVTETTDTYREMISSLQDFYHLRVNSRTNEVMKFLTAMTTIFMPLSFLAGLFGMNFRYLPGVDSPQAPFILAAAMGCIALIMTSVFVYKKWL